jgi:hypothetical protein
VEELYEEKENPIPEGDWPQSFTNLRHNLEKEENWHRKAQNKVDDLTMINCRRYLGATERNKEKHCVPLISSFLLSNDAVSFKTM